MQAESYLPRRAEPARNCQGPVDELVTLAARVETRIADEALELLGAAWPQPRIAVPLAESFGIGPEHFPDDRKIIWASLDVARDYCSADRFKLAAMALRANLAWDQYVTPAIHWRGPLWSDAMLEALAGGWFHSEQFIRFHSQQLIGLHRRLRDAREHLAYAVRLLSESEAA